MNTAIYTIFDNVACEAGPIFQAKNLLVASRMVKHMIEKTPIKPTEFELVCLGTFDSETLELKVFSHDERSSISLASAVILGSDANEFMDKNATPDDVKQFKENYSEEDE